MVAAESSPLLRDGAAYGDVESVDAHMPSAPQNDRAETPEPASRRSTYARAAVVCAALVGSASAVVLAGGRAGVAGPNSAASDMLAESAQESSSSLSLAFKVKNEYIQDSALGTSYPWINEWKLAEPHRKSTFEVEWWKLVNASAAKEVSCVTELTRMAPSNPHHPDSHVALGLVQPTTQVTRLN